ncbi:ATP-binding protein [Nocardia sp. NPDC020380]|uniref:ATP-binding protein n=1 Tax=Nocardia sp. NPDC020380 TaxID=3364309 RepID=UPI0037910F5A
MHSVHSESTETTARIRLSYAAEASALAPIRRSLRNWLSHSAIGHEDTCDLVLAVTEACTNSIEHAYSAEAGTLQVEGELLDDHVWIAVTDDGRWRPAVQDAEALRGRGIGIIRTLIPDSIISTSAAGTTVEMRVPLCA